MLSPQAPVWLEVTRDGGRDEDLEGTGAPVSVGGGGCPREGMMNVQGADILSDVTEKTSRNLKATAVIVMAVKLFNVRLQGLEVLGIGLPPNLFDVVSFALIGYMMIVLIAYWRADYLLWRDGPLLVAKDILGRLRGIKDIVTDVEQFLEREAADNVKFIQDHIGAMKVELLDHRRSIANITWWVCFVIWVLHLVIPLSLGAFAVWLVWEDALAALSGLL